ncbi:MAG TPA: GNAT family N-acetyltransferase [Candidatus Acidoferrales bacterium]|nr:GNAT family N-acetyltransferase [Candidatus Acidoferrales bacterium]
MSSDLQLRLATPADVSALTQLIELSVRGLQAQDYSVSQIELALKHVYGVDTQLIADGTYFAVESTRGKAPLLVGCGGWSKRKTLYGGDAWNAREDSLLDPRRDAAKIRAFFVHPDWARHGIGTMILDACEAAARSAGFARCEMGATLTGVPFYRAKGYAELEHLDVPLPGGPSLPIIRMAKSL